MRNPRIRKIHAEIYQTRFKVNANCLKYYMQQTIEEKHEEDTQNYCMKIWQYRN